METLRSRIAREHTAINTLLATGYRSCLVLHADGTVDKEVTNLGWLLRRAGDVVHPHVGVGFTVKGWKYDGLASGGYAKIVDFDPVLIAHLSWGGMYATQFADVHVLYDWLNRPKFKSYVVDWDYSHAGCLITPSTVAIGGKDYADLPRHRKHYTRALPDGTPITA